MIRKGLRPALRFGFGASSEQGAWSGTWRFRRSWPVIIVLAIMDAVFMIPLFLTYGEAFGNWGGLDDLFSVVGALFMTAWMIGWSMAPLIMTAILLMMLFGREVLRVGPGKVDLFLGLPFVGLSASYDVSKMRNLRVERPVKKSGKSWRGPHFVFDYGANSVEFGSDASENELAEVDNAIQMGSGTAVRRGDARPEDIQTPWEDPRKEASPEPRAVSPADVAPPGLTSASTLTLIAANLVPVAGTLFLGWRLSDVMVLYWAESAVIGFFNLCKIAVIGRWAALFAGPFFLGHFGAFMAVHFLFIYTLFVKGPAGMDDAGGSLSEVAALFVALWPALLALFLSHAYSFFANFIGRREYRGRKVGDQMSEPYSRIVFMHLVLIFGGGLSLVLGQAEPVLILVIALKIVFDVRAHLKERRGRERRR